MHLVYSTSGGGLVALLDAFRRKFIVPSWNDVGFFLQHVAGFPSDRLVLPFHSAEDFAALSRTRPEINNAVLNTRDPRDAAVSLMKKRMLRVMVVNPSLRQAVLAGQVLPEKFIPSYSDFPQLFDFGGEVEGIRTLGVPDERIHIVDLTDLMPQHCAATSARLAPAFGVAPADLPLPTTRVNSNAAYFLYHQQLRLSIGFDLTVTFGMPGGHTTARGLQRLATFHDVPFADRPGAEPYPTDVDVHWAPQDFGLTGYTLPLIEQVARERITGAFSVLRKQLEATLQESLAASDRLSATYDMAPAIAAAWGGFAPRKHVFYALRPDLEAAWEAAWEAR